MVAVPVVARGKALSQVAFLVLEAHSLCCQEGYLPGVQPVTPLTPSQFHGQQVGLVDLPDVGSKELIHQGVT